MRIARQLNLSASLIVLTAFGLVNAAPHDEAMAAMSEYQAGLGTRKFDPNRSRQALHYLRHSSSDARLLPLPW
ncbi:hypothetical protein BDZ90DRAFT_231937 [Jaminaea rosea]|uniref:Uncharacterized protein n=1 Tax=Jaminaea rosea TaxID=1569628 RepID=A0A316UTP6_9BASI|nr:hypothetical protein BDZ90DRAFT_231937 [Jaminaea rosea]PWN28178.1 hypothetical protein BDZ90DRAFT_231937 [Jaminaea rosea]